MTAEEASGYGEVFTRRWVVDALLDLTGYTAERDLARMTLVEPSVGAGAFLLPIVERLLASARARGRRHEDLGAALRCFDVQRTNVELCRKMTAAVLVADGCDSDLADRLADTWIVEQDFLLDEARLEANVVVGNPPYIRIEDLNPDLAIRYRSRWQTMSGRADIYVGFYERSLSSLKPGGVLGFICADRWMRNQYGARLRDFVTSDFSVESVWTMHDVDAFEEEVSAYPAITIIRRASNRTSCVAATTRSFGQQSAAELVQWTSNAHSADARGSGYVAHRLPHWFTGNQMWPSGSPRRLALLEYLNDAFAPLEDERTGTRIGIGVATGADGVFVISDPELVERARALPLAMGGDLRTGQFRWGGNYLANPWLADGSLVDLQDYPKLAAHLESAGNSLRQRHTARKSPAKWYKTIDKVHLGLMSSQLLLLRDMGTAMNPVLAPPGFYPHHNLYFIASTGWDLEVLGGLLLSRIAQAFIEAYGVRMRGGTLRFQSQYLRQIRVPDPARIGPELGDRLKRAFRLRDAAEATEAAAIAYAIDDLAKYDVRPDRDEIVR
jgi:adenine-specific DNA-methyltransferase